MRLLSISKDCLKYQLSFKKEAKLKYQNIFLARIKESNMPKERHVTNSSYWKLNEELFLTTCNVYNPVFFKCSVFVIEALHHRNNIHLNINLEKVKSVTF